VEARIKKHLLPFFGGWRASGVSRDDVLRFIDQQREAEYTNGEINNQLAVVVRRYRLAVEGGKLISRPAIKKLETNNARQGFFEREQFEAIRSYLAPPLQALVTFGYLTGWRIRSEVQTLEWRHVDFAAAWYGSRWGPRRTRQAGFFRSTCCRSCASYWNGSAPSRLRMRRRMPAW